MRTKTTDTLYIASPKLNQLNIAAELAADPYLTQAELARRCDLSVSMVNNYLKSLCSFGWLEYHRRSSKDVSYHMTPQGLEQLDSMQHELIHEMVSMFQQAKERILAIIAKGADRKLQRVAVCGSGNLAQLACEALRASGVDVVPPLECSPGDLDAPDALVVALEFPWAVDNLGRILEYAQQRGIHVVRLNGDLSQISSDDLQRENLQSPATVGAGPR